LSFYLRNIVSGDIKIGDIKIEFINYRDQLAYVFTNSL